ncbi:hypothetical protein LOZ66_006784 [Ophidiomyces ophidiicola]|nr:hypothetical protein LOZ65_006817 [Ophidiomyces ophidiicola]KAI1932717.1 hypothetical protein LOZ66_006784 [Ophidiomyces ophidiicola]
MFLSPGEQAVDTKAVSAMHSGMASYRCYTLHQGSGPRPNRSSVGFIELEWKLFGNDGNPIYGSIRPKCFAYRDGRPVDEGLSKWERLAVESAPGSPTGSVIAIKETEPGNQPGRLLGVRILEIDGSRDVSHYAECTLEFATKSLARAVVGAATICKELKYLFGESMLKEMSASEIEYFSLYHVKSWAKADVFAHDFEGLSVIGSSQAPCGLAIDSA